MPLLLSAIIVAVPTYLYAWIVRNVDRYEKEPVKYLIAAFLWGAVPSILLALVAQVIFAVPVIALLGENSRAGQLLQVAVFGPISEEVLKAFAVGLIYLWRRREFDGWVDGIVYGSTVGFGFAYVENIFYLSSAENLSSWFFLFFLRVIIFGFMHGFWTSLTGIGFGLARHVKSDFVKASFIAVGLGLAIFGHAVHNGSLVLTGTETSGLFMCLTALNYLALIGLMIGLNLVGGRKERELMRAGLQDEVPGVLSQEIYDALSNNRAHSTMAPKTQRELTQLACELALKKRQLDNDPDDGKTVALIDELRAKVRAFNPQAEPLQPVAVGPDAPAASVEPAPAPEQTPPPSAG
jgi:protease PrsW